MKMNTYVNFAGVCAEAVRYYEKHPEGKVGMMPTDGRARGHVRQIERGNEHEVHDIR
jgi:hypothetical protein